MGELMFQLGRFVQGLTPLASCRLRAAGATRLRPYGAVLRQPVGLNELARGVSPWTGGLASRES